MIRVHNTIVSVFCDLCHRVPNVFMNLTRDEALAILKDNGWYIDDDVHACPQCHSECEGDYAYDTILEAAEGRTRFNARNRGGK